MSSVVKCFHILEGEEVLSIRYLSVSGCCLRVLIKADLLGSRLPCWKLVSFGCVFHLV